MKNGQSAALDLSNEQLQVLLTAKFGDGHFTKEQSSTTYSSYITNCKYKEYLEFKQKLLGNLCTQNIGYTEKNGYSQTPIYRIQTYKNKSISDIKNLSTEESLNLMDELGLALWIYDDGSLHKDKYFYNLNTQAFTKEINEDLLIPFLDQYGIKAKSTIERKKRWKRILVFKNR